MRYNRGGVEIQYRECQIMREAAKDFAAPEAGYLLKNEGSWLEAMTAEVSKHKIKATLIPPMIQFLSQMDTERKTAVAEYVEYLVRKVKGIDIMVPFTASNQYVILPVNIHEPADAQAFPEDDEERE